MSFSQFVRADVEEDIDLISLRKLKCSDCVGIVPVLPCGTNHSTTRPLGSAHRSASRQGSFKARQLSFGSINHAISPAHRG